MAVLKSGQCNSTTNFVISLSNYSISKVGTNILKINTDIIISENVTGELEVIYKSTYSVFYQIQCLECLHNVLLSIIARTYSICTNMQWVDFYNNLCTCKLCWNATSKSATPRVFLPIKEEQKKKCKIFNANNSVYEDDMN